MQTHYDDSRLQRVFKELEPKNRRKVFQTAFRRVGNYVRKEAQRNLEASGLHNAGMMKKAIHTVVFRKDVGFTVSVRGKKEARMHRNRFGKLKPIARWAASGTKMRSVKTTRPIRFRSSDGFKTATTRRRGFMDRYDYMSKTQAQTEGKVTQMLRDELPAAVIKIAEKYGKI